MINSSRVAHFGTRPTHRLVSPSLCAAAIFIFTLWKRGVSYTCRAVRMGRAEFRLRLPLWVTYFDMTLRLRENFKVLHTLGNIPQITIFLKNLPLKLTDGLRQMARRLKRHFISSLYSLKKSVDVAAARPRKGWGNAGGRGVGGPGGSPIVLFRRTTFDYKELHSTRNDTFQSFNYFIFLPHRQQYSGSQWGLEQNSETWFGSFCVVGWIDCRLAHLSSTAMVILTNSHLPEAFLADVECIP